MPRLPKPGDTLDLIELRAACPIAQDAEFTGTLSELLAARGVPGVTYTYRRINARVIEVLVYKVDGVKRK